MPDTNRQDALRALALLDLTDLSDACTPSAVTRLCARAVTPHGPVAAICIWPAFVSQAARELARKPVRIATVVNFPKGRDAPDMTAQDAREAIRDGAHEIDLVLPYEAFLRGDLEEAREMLVSVREAVGTHVLKVILETGALASPEAIASASRMAIDSGANFIKTSTGKTAVSATPQAAQAMLAAIKKSGKPVGFKASGGVRTLDEARAYLALADTIMGAGWATPLTFRFGASGLLDALLAALDGGAGAGDGDY